MPALAMLPTLLKYWWVGAIIVLVVWVKIDSARLHSAQTALESTKAEFSVALKNNADLKGATDKCNAEVDKLQSDGLLLQSQVAEAQKAIITAKQVGDQTVKGILANKPKSDCESITKYLRQQAGQYKWAN